MPSCSWFIWSMVPFFFSAPFCHTEFLCAWIQTVTDNTQTQSVFNQVLNPSICVVLKTQLLLVGPPNRSRVLNFHHDSKRKQNTFMNRSFCKCTGETSRASASLIYLGSVYCLVYASCVRMDPEDLKWISNICNKSPLRLLLLRSPAISLRFTIFGWDFCVCDRFFNLTIKVVTFRLRGWCVLGVFVAGIYPSRTWTSGSFESVRWNACVHRLDLGLYSHPKEFWGGWSFNPC